MNRNVKMTNVESVDTVLQYLSYLQLLITEITGHKGTMEKTKGPVKDLGKRKFGKTQVFMSNRSSSCARFY